MRWCATGSVDMNMAVPWLRLPSPLTLIYRSIILGLTSSCSAITITDMTKRPSPSTRTSATLLCGIFSLCTAINSKTLDLRCRAFLYPAETKPYTFELGTLFFSSAATATQLPFSILGYNPISYKEQPTSRLWSLLSFPLVLFFLSKEDFISFYHSCLALFPSPAGTSTLSGPISICSPLSLSFIGAGTESHRDSSGRMGWEIGGSYRPWFMCVDVEAEVGWCM